MTLDREERGCSEADGIVPMVWLHSERLMVRVVATGQMDHEDRQQWDDAGLRWVTLDV